MQITLNGQHTINAFAVDLSYSASSSELHIYVRCGIALCVKGSEEKIDVLRKYLQRAHLENLKWSGRRQFEQGMVCPVEVQNVEVAMLNTNTNNPDHHKQE